jgi:hypothetical protein
MAASLMLLLVTWYTVTSFLKTGRIDPGSELANLNLVSLDPVRDGYSAADAAALFTKLPEELGRVHGVRATSLVDSLPFAIMAASQSNTRVSTAAPGSQSGPLQHAIYRQSVGADYFAAMGTPMVGGREFDRRDQAQDGPESEGATAVPAILNQTAAHELFGVEDPIGRPIREGERNYTVVGLARDTQHGFLMSKPVATMFVPLTSAWFRKNPAQPATLLVRGTPGGNTLVAVRNQLASLHPGLTVFSARTMREDLDRLNTWVQWDAAIYEALGVLLSSWHASDWRESRPTRWCGGRKKSGSEWRSAPPAGKCRVSYCGKVRRSWRSVRCSALVARSSCCARFRLTAKCWRGVSASLPVTHF